MKDLIYPIKIIAEVNVENSSALKIKSYPQIGLSEPNLCTIKKGGYIIVDFGMEYVGGIRLLSRHGSQKVRIRTGESVMEACSELGENGSCNDHSLRDITVMVPDYSDNSYFKTGFRFARVDNLSDQDFTLKSLILVSDEADLEQVGSFECDDPVINKIFSTAVRTLKLNAQNGVLYDGIKRDRLVWVGDLHPEVLAYTCLFDDYSYVVNSLEYSIESTPLPQWMNNGFPSYSMWFLLIFCDYVFHSNDQTFFEKHKDYVYKTAIQVSNLVDDEGKLNLGFVFLDWPSTTFPDKGINGVVALCVKSLTAVCDMLCGYDCTGIRCKINLLKAYYDKPCDYKQGAALRIYASLNQSADVITLGGAKGFSTFMSYYLLDAVAKEYGAEKSNELLKEYYGKMLDLGATTFFEDFDIEWARNADRIDKVTDPDKIDVHGSKGDFCYKGYRHSLCHGWASGPIQYLIKRVAGINAEDFGCKKISVKPDLGGLKYVKVKFPTPYGVVKVECDKDGLKKAELPKGVELVK
ncbi:MAG: alpha-L-rhamnosidase [Clostridiales bacterium]|nr:alpha-L-rhamnosidase [Clostridiales bacterium]